jgi:hypothetical protein
VALWKIKDLIKWSSNLPQIESTTPALAPKLSSFDPLFFFYFSTSLNSPNINFVHGRFSKNFGETPKPRGFFYQIPQISNFNLTFPWAYFIKDFGTDASKSK